MSASPPTSPAGRARRALRGFTLIELIVTIVVLGVLAALAIPALSAVRDRSADEATATELAAMHRYAEALSAFEDRPATRQDYETAAADAQASETLTTGTGLVLLPEGATPTEPGTVGLDLADLDGGGVAWRLSAPGRAVDLVQVNGSPLPVVTMAPPPVPPTPSLALTVTRVLDADASAVAAYGAHYVEWAPTGASSYGVAIDGATSTHDADCPGGVCRVTVAPADDAGGDGQVVVSVEDATVVVPTAVPAPTAVTLNAHDDGTATLGLRHDLGHLDPGTWDVRLLLSVSEAGQPADTTEHSLGTGPWSGCAPTEDTCTASLPVGWGDVSVSVSAYVERLGAPGPGYDTPGLTSADVTATSVPPAGTNVTVAQTDAGDGTTYLDAEWDAPTLHPEAQPVAWVVVLDGTELPELETYTPGPCEPGTRCQAGPAEGVEPGTYTVQVQAVAQDAAGQVVRSALSAPAAVEVTP